MKNKLQTKLKLSKLNISKLQNPSQIQGGDSITKKTDTTTKLTGLTKNGTALSTRKCRPGGGGGSTTNCRPSPVLSTKACA